MPVTHNATISGQQKRGTPSLSPGSWPCTISRMPNCSAPQLFDFAATRAPIGEGALRTPSPIYFVTRALRDPQSPRRQPVHALWQAADPRQGHEAAVAGVHAKDVDAWAAQAILVGT